MFAQPSIDSISVPSAIIEILPDKGTSQVWMFSTIQDHFKIPLLFQSECCPILFAPRLDLLQSG